MPDHTTTSAAQYLADHGYTVKRRRVGGEGPPSADTIKRWCLEDKELPRKEQRLPGARKAGHAWLIPQKALDNLIKAKDSL